MVEICLDVAVVACFDRSCKDVADSAERAVGDILTCADSDRWRSSNEVEDRERSVESKPVRR